LTRGFVGRLCDYWMRGLRGQMAREVPQGYPRFGYMLDHEGAPVSIRHAGKSGATSIFATCRIGMSGRGFATTRRC
jgi:hypothetical protein